MFKVDLDAVGRYRISIGVGKRFTTTSLTEVQIALGHYYGCHPLNTPDCLLCKAVQRRLRE